VIVDYAWPRFLCHGRDFIEAVADDQAVCDLLSALRSDSVCAPGGLYASAMPHPDAPMVSCGMLPLSFVVYGRHICLAKFGNTEARTQLHLSVALFWYNKCCQAAPSP
jgi:hypothetical protein